MNDDLVFIDSNVILYTLDPTNAGKRRVAQEAVKVLAEEETGVVSMQIVFEIRNVGTRKLRLGADVLRDTFREIRERFRVVPVTFEAIDLSFDIQASASLSAVDSVMIATASLAGCNVLLTEDLNPGQVIAGVKVVNPFVVAT